MGPLEGGREVMSTWTEGWGHWREGRGSSHHYLWPSCKKLVKEVIAS